METRHVNDCRRVRSREKKTKNQTITIYYVDDVCVSFFFFFVLTPYILRDRSNPFGRLNVAE